MSDDEDSTKKPTSYYTSHNGGDRGESFARRGSDNNPPPPRQQQQQQRRSYESYGGDNRGSSSSGGPESRGNYGLPLYGNTNYGQNCRNVNTTDPKYVDSALIAALKEPKERIALLKLESVLVEFVTNDNKYMNGSWFEIAGPYYSIIKYSHDNSPPGNNPLPTTFPSGFQRCLIHRLSDRFSIVRELGHALGPNALRLIKKPASHIPELTLQEYYDKHFHFGSDPQQQQPPQPPSQPPPQARGANEQQDDYSFTRPRSVYSSRDTTPRDNRDTSRERGDQQQTSMSLSSGDRGERYNKRRRSNDDRDVDDDVYSDMDVRNRRPDLVIVKVSSGGSGKNRDSDSHGISAKYAFPESVIHPNLASLLGLIVNPSGWEQQQDQQQEWKVDGRPIKSSKVELNTDILNELGVDRYMCRCYVELCNHGGHETEAFQFMVLTNAPDDLLDLYYSRCVTHEAEYFFGQTMENLRKNDFDLYVENKWSSKPFEDGSGTPTFADDDCKYVQLHDIDHTPGTLDALRQRIHTRIARLSEVRSLIQHLPSSRRKDIIRKGLLHVDIPLYNIPAAV